MKINNVVKMTDSSVEYFIGKLDKESIIKMVSPYIKRDVLDIYSKIRFTLDEQGEYVMVRPFVTGIMPMNTYNSEEIIERFFKKEIKLNIFGIYTSEITFYYSGKNKVECVGKSSFVADFSIIERSIRLAMNENDSVPSLLHLYNNSILLDTIINDNIKKSYIKTYNHEKSIFEDLIGKVIISAFYCNKSQALYNFNNKTNFWFNIGHKIEISDIISNNIEYMVIFVDINYNVSFFDNYGTIYNEKLTECQEEYIVKAAMMYNNYFEKKIIPFKPQIYAYYPNNIKSIIFTLLMSLKVLENNYNKSLAQKTRMCKYIYHLIIQSAIN